MPGSQLKAEMIVKRGAEIIKFQFRFNDFQNILNGRNNLLKNFRMLLQSTVIKIFNGSIPPEIIFHPGNKNRCIGKNRLILFINNSAYMIWMSVGNKDIGNIFGVNPVFCKLFNRNPVLSSANIPIPVSIRISLSFVLTSRILTAISI